MSKFEEISVFEIDSEENKSIHTIKVANDRFVDVMWNKITGLMYVMQNDDGSVMFDNQGNTIEGNIDEDSVIAFLKFQSIEMKEVVQRNIEGDVPRTVHTISIGYNLFVNAIVNHATSNIIISKVFDENEKFIKIKIDEDKIIAFIKEMIANKKES